jgi:hypothetical protein
MAKRTPTINDYAITIRMSSEGDSEDFEYDTLLEAEEGLARLKASIKAQRDGVTRELMMFIKEESCSSPDP